MFRRLGKVPVFELKTVGFGRVTEDKSTSSVSSSCEEKQLWRRYTLVIPHFECEILEVFPSREMFTAGEKWLNTDDTDLGVSELLVASKGVGEAPSLLKQSINIGLAVGLFITLFYEVAMYNSGRSRFC